MAHLKWINESELQRSFNLQVAPQELKCFAKNTHAHNLNLWIDRMSIDEIRKNVSNIQFTDE